LAKKPASRGPDQFLIRLPEGMRDRIAKLAATNGRSMNTEMISLLEKSLADHDTLKTLEIQVAEIWTKLDELDHRTIDTSNWLAKVARALP